MATVYPTNMQKPNDAELVITWNDGRDCTYNMRKLRGQCPCAECVEETTGQRVVFEKDVPEGIVATEARPVGRYAYQFIWSDGHTTGLYTYEYLRNLCERAEE